MAQPLRLINAEQALGILQFPSLVQAMYEAHQAAPAQRQDLLMTDQIQGGDNNHFFLRAAWQSGLALGAKLITVLPENNKHAKLPSIQSLYVLFDAKTGAPLACIDGNAITWYKTAADSALGAKFLAREDAKSLLMVGCGTMAPFLIQAHLAVRPSINKLMLWNRNQKKAERLASQLPSSLDIQIVDNLERAAPKADVISCANMTQQPLIHGAWLSPGSHLDLVGGFTPDMREADDEAIKRSKVFVDCYSTTLADVGDIYQPLQSGVLKKSAIQADLYELCAGKHPGRQNANEITLYKNAGGGHLDLMTANHLLKQLEQ